MYLLCGFMSPFSLGCSWGLQVCEDTERSTALRSSFCPLKAPADAAEEGRQWQTDSPSRQDPP